MVRTVRFWCAECGDVASTVTLVMPKEADPRLAGAAEASDGAVDTDPLGGWVLPDRARLSIDGGPISVTIGPVLPTPVDEALASGDAAQLFAIDREFAPFWCPTCAASYCRAHYPTVTLFDDGFFDCINGRCPRGHERTLQD